MNKVLAGSSKEALTFLSVHWRGLLSISIVPMIIIIAIAWYQIQGMGVMFEFMAAQAQNGDKIDPATFPKFFSGMMTFYGVGLISLFATVWLFVRIVRFWKNGAGAMFGVTEGELGATFMTIVYGVGMLFLTLAVYVVGIIAFAIAAAIVAAIGMAISDTTVLAAIGMFLLIVALGIGIFGLVVFFYRFLVGLPGVALGEVPGFFSDIWPLAKGESFALPLRVLMWTIVGAIPILILASIFSFPLMIEIQDQLKGQNPPEITPAMMSRIFSVMAPLQMINLVVQIPLIWLLSVLLSVAHFRFRKKLSG